MSDQDVREFASGHPVSSELLGGNLLTKYWEAEMLRMLAVSEVYRCMPPVRDMRPWWKKAWQLAYWGTVARYKAWLHRDCGEY